MHFLIPWVVLLLYVTLLQAAPPTPLGLYALDDTLKNGTKPTLPPFTQGVTVRLQWSMVQLDATTFNWTGLDASVARAQAAGQQVQIGIHPGTGTPQFVYQAGAARFRMLWDLAFSHPNCTFVSFPIPWDQVYLSYWQKFLQALAERYDNNTAVAGIKVAGLNAQTMELVVPSKNVSDCGNAWDPTEEWIKLGYTPQRVIDTFTKILGFYQAAFHNTKLVLMTGDFPWPAIDNHGNRTPELDTNLSHTLLLQFAQTVPDGEVANNGLSVWRKWIPPADLPKSIAIGSQALWYITEDATCRMNGHHTPCHHYYEMNRTLQNVLDVNVTYFEIYLVDLINPSFAGLLENFTRHFHPNAGYNP